MLSMRWSVWEYGLGLFMAEIYWRSQPSAAETICTEQPGVIHHTIENHTYGIHATTEQGGVWMVHFLWGKKDFRIYLERAGSSSAEKALPGLLNSEASGNLAVSRVQYLYEFEWYEYDRVAGHGLALEEVRWLRGKLKRYLELPREFLNVAVELACREFGLERVQQGSAA